MNEAIALVLCLLVLPIQASHAQAAPPEGLETVLEHASSMDPMQSLLIWHQDSLLVEEYYRGLRPGRAVNIKSASKTVLSALVGMALQRGEIDSLDQPLHALLPDRYRPADPEKAGISFRNAITMRTGLETTSFDNYGAWASSSDWVRFQLRQPIECRPGSCWGYSTGTSHMVGVVLSHQSGESLLDLARTRLFGPLGARLSPWDRDPQGFYLGGNNMGVRPTDLLSFGRLYLNDGVWNGRRLLPEGWVQSSWETYGRSPWNGNRYGFFWWNRTLAGEEAFFAWGYGGQYVFVVPRLKLVVVTTASLSNRPRGVNHNREVYRLMERIIPVMRRRHPGEMAR
jgi:CubicO group peptidase (beta-lactamase class C family)